ncbi:RNA-directed DNA polymerase, eukaryota [Tanacetum coccineum]|uniref:RNA-directed DNA polymerase, eukaryota n=1 Tax=Tanacetum coccineum TaxID=301880 RepID=A0ABQ5J732_9ASTR
MASFVQPSKVKINMGPVKNSFVSVLKSNDHKGSPSSDSPAIVMDDSCIVDNDLSCSLMGKIKNIIALSNIYVIFADEGFDNVNISYLGGFWILIEACSIASKEKMLNHEGLASWFSELCIANPSFVIKDRLVWISIEGLPFNTWNNNAYAKIISQWGTLSEVDTTPDSSSSTKKICVVTKVYTIINQRIKIIVKGKIYWICVKELEAWAPEFNNKFCENLSSDEESMEDEEFNSQKVDDIDHISESSCMKECNEQQAPKTDARKSDPSYPPGFTPKGVNETIKEEENVSVNKSNSNHHCNKKTCSNGKCGSNRSFKLKAGGSILDVMRDLIEIGHAMGYNIEGCLGHTSKKDWIQELNLKYKVNFATIQETKSEKIDIFAIKSLWGNFNFDFVYSPSVGLSGGILCVWNPNVFAKESVIVSDSFVVVRDFNEVRLENERFGTIFNDIGAKAFNQFISSSCLINLPLEGHLSDHKPILLRESYVDYGPTPFRVFHSWFTNDGFDNLIADTGNNLSIMETNKISLLRKKFQALKAIIKNWSRDDMLKASALRHSALSQISELDKLIDKGQTINLDSYMFQKIYIDQNADLESDVSLEEIKKAVWECGTNKSLGPDGFSFKFIRKYWNIIQHDVVNTVKEIFSSSKFPPGSNSSFITFIPKSLDAKMVKDFRPISLIGSFYKIVAKILSNRLCIVMPDLISDVQTAFISKRQILDGPFILNELISWCKYHKIKAMIFKADFEKAFDSVRWDYLDGVLNNFGFGVKWRGWIQACLSSAMGSILVNGSPSSEFKFHKGLKQGDPLSPFLFILVMESLHILFNNILNSRLYKGIRIDESLTSLLCRDEVVVHGSLIAMFGDGEFRTNTGKFARSSTWTTIVRECGNLSSKGINLLSHMKRKVGNGRLPRGSLEEEQFSKLIEDVNSVILSVSNDRWIWSLDSSGEFSIKSTRLFIDDHLLLAVGAPTRWVSEVPIKINIMAWKVSLDKLPTRLNLSLRGIEIPSITCPICSCAGESCSHLFFSCSMARNITTKLARWWEFDCPDLFSYDDWLEWFHTLRLLKGFKDILEGVFYVMWWVIWKYRNQTLFGSSQPRMDMLFDEIVLLSFTWCSNRCKNNFDWISWMKCPRSLSL